MNRDRSEQPTVRAAPQEARERTSDAPTGSLSEGPTASGGLESHKPVSEAPTVGAVIDRYTILERIGGGGMGEVYAAYDGKLDRKIALKVLRHKGDQYEARLSREAQAMARLSHSNVVAVFDTGRFGTKLYLAMEFVRGVTLRAWQREGHSLQEILRVYAEAGRGLAAAHEAGLVHRDFKPDNVLIADDGRVKVTDFGIARAFEERSAKVARKLAHGLGSTPATLSPGAVDSEASLTPQPSTTSIGSKPSSLDTPMTEEGHLLGTPGYMASEQYLCEGVDARTDQYAFCVSLYEALYGEKPIATRDADGKPLGLQQVAQASLEGKVRDAPKGSNVPLRIRRILLRGLSVEPAARYASMEQLLAELARDPARQRRRAIGAIAAVAAVSGLVFVSARTASSQRAKLCTGTEAEAAEAWNTDAANRAEKALLATGVPHAADTWRRTRAELDGYMRRWSDMHQQTCEATRIHGHQTESVMTLRMSCLDQRKSEVKALAQVLATADANVAGKALQASMSLTSVDVCKDIATLTAVAPEPTAPEKRAQLKAIRLGLASIKEKIGAGRYAEARDEAGPLVGQAKELGYAPALADALLFAAQAKGSSGASRDESISLALDAVAQADSGHLDATRAEAATLLMGWMTDAANYAEAEHWSKISDGVINRIDHNEALRASWLSYASKLSGMQGRLEEAAARGREAVEIAKKGNVAPEILAELERRLANEEAMIGHQKDAERAATDADELVSRTMGPDHPVRIHVVETKGYVAAQGHDLRGAVEHYRKAIELTERASGLTPNLVVDYSNVCEALADLNEPEGALRFCEKARDGAAAVFGPESPITAHTYAHMGFTLLALRLPGDATANLEKAIAIYEKTGAPPDADYAAALERLGEAKLRGGDARAAVPLFERAVAMPIALHEPPPEFQLRVARARFGLAQARWAQGERTAKVGELTRAAMETYRSVGKSAEAQEAEDWLAGHH